MKKLLAIVFLSLVGFSAWAEEVLLIEGTRIRGNQELPTVLYVVPWQPVELKIIEPPTNSFTIHQPVKMLERNEFKRMVSYHNKFLGKEDK